MMGTLSGGQLRVTMDGVGISCPASKPARPSLLLKFSSGTSVRLRPGDWGLDFQHQPGILRLMNARHDHPIILLREVEKGEWWMEMPRVTVEIDDRLDEGIDWMRSGEFRKATAIFSQLIKELPEHLDAYHHLALTQQRAGKGKEAADVWRCAVELALKFFPERFDFDRHQLPWLEIGNRPFLRAYHGLGLCLLDEGQIEPALEIFERLLTLNSHDNQGARALVVGCYFELQRPEEVLSLCRQHPNDGMEQLVYGRPLALFQLGRLKTATTALNRAIKFLPLIAKELVRKRHRRPPGTNDGYVTMGGADQAYGYWKDQGKHWHQTPGALEWLKDCLKSEQSGAA